MIKSGGKPPFLTMRLIKLSFGLNLSTQLISQVWKGGLPPLLFGC